MSPKSLLSSQDPTQSTKHKLLHLASDSYRGGAESVFRNTIEQTLTLPEYEIFVASCDTPQSLPKGIDSKHFLALDDWANYPKPIGALKYVFNLKNYRILKNFLLTTRPDIIHTQNYLSRLSPSVLFALRSYKRKFPHTRLIFTQHNFGVCPNGGLYNYAQKSICEACIGHSKFRIMWKNCDRRGRIYSILKGVRTLFYCGIFMREDKLFDKILCVGEFQCQKHKDDGFNPKKLEVLQNPIQMQFYNPDVRLEDKQNLIVFFGRLAPEKNVPLLIEAFAKLIQKPEFTSYQLCIIGDGEDRAHCENLARSLLTPKIAPNPRQTHSQDSQGKITHYTFLGRQSPTEIARILKNAKLSVVPSLWYEGVPLVITESIMAGVLPIGSDIGGIKEGIQSHYGFTFRLQDREHLCLVLSEVLENFDEYFENLTATREEILANIENLSYLKKLIKVYDSTSGGGAIILIHSSLIEALLSQVVVPVRFIGRRTPTEIAGILKHAKIAVVPSLWYETFGLVIVESILAGALPLVSRIGALKETIERFCGCSFAFEVDESKPYNERFLANVENLEIVLGSSLRSYEEIWQEFITKREEIVQNLSNPKYLRNLMKIYDLGGGGHYLN